MSADDSANPAQYTTWAEFWDPPPPTKTTAQVDWDGVQAAGWRTSPEIQSILAELVASYDYSAGAAMCFLHHDDGGADGAYEIFYSYDQASTYGPKLHIVYTAGAAAGLTWAMWI